MPELIRVVQDWFMLCGPDGVEAFKDDTYHLYRYHTWCHGSRRDARMASDYLHKQSEDEFGHASHEIMLWLSSYPKEPEELPNWDTAQGPTEPREV